MELRRVSLTLYPRASQSVMTFPRLSRATSSNGTSVATVRTMGSWELNSMATPPVTWPAAGWQ